MNAARAQGNPLLDVEWEPCLLEKKRDPELEAFVKREIGVMPPLFSHIARCPWLVKAEVWLSYDRHLLMHLDKRLADLAGMATSLESACRCCYATSRLLLRLQGMSETRVREMEQMIAGASADPRQRAAIAFARRMSRSDPLVNENDKQALTDSGFTPEEIHELAYVIAYIVFANRVATLPALPPYELEAMPDKWLTRLLRPLMARQLFKRTGPGRPVTDIPDYNGPYNYLVDAYAPSPIAAALAISLKGIWDDRILTRRCKGLLLAVVAHALGCRKTAAEAEQMLVDEGLPADSLEQVLNHLRSPQLDETEAMLVPFARQTIWYRPAQVQREARRVVEQIGAERFTEAVGILAMANALCRLGAAVVPHP